MQTLRKQAILTSEQLSDAKEVLRKFKLNAEPSVTAASRLKGVAGIVLAAPQDGWSKSASDRTTACSSVIASTPTAAAPISARSK